MLDIRGHDSGSARTSRSSRPPSPASGDDVVVIEDTPRSPAPSRVSALDGLRGVAVIVVVLYHLAPDRLPGGFLGVSMFFVLSGFLITSLLFNESAKTGRIDLAAFWTRRFRRLLPAALAALALAVAVAALVGDPHQLETLPGDIAASLVYVTNWHFISEGVAYGAHYQQPSVVEHFWSLAIEEQFYIVVAILAFALAKVRASRRTWAIVFGSLAAASMVVTLTMGSSEQMGIYFGTTTRAFELLAGSLMAIGLTGRISSHRTSRSTDRVGQIMGMVALAAIGVACVLVSIDDSIVYNGGLWVIAGLTVVVLLAIRHRGPLTHALSWKPLMAVGLVSYGVYLFHWPLFILISDDTVSGPVWLVPVLRLGATAIFTVASYYLLEQPIRLQRWHLSPGRVLTALSVSVVVILGGSYLVGAQSHDRAVVAAPDVAIPVSSSATASPTTVPGAPAAPVTPMPKTVLMMGDSMLQDAFPTMEYDFAAKGITATSVGGKGETILTDYSVWLTELTEAVERDDPDVVVLESCCGDQKSVRLPDGRSVRADEPGYWEAWDAASRQATDIASSRGARVMWVIPPPADGELSQWYGDIKGRMLTVSDIQRQIALERPDVMLVDWGVLSGPDGSFSMTMFDRSGDEITVRETDGVHFTPDGQGLQSQTTVEQVIANWMAAGGRTP